MNSGEASRSCAAQRGRRSHGAFLPVSESGSGGRAWFLGASGRKPGKPVCQHVLSLPPPGVARRRRPTMIPTLHPHAAGIDAGSTHFFVATPDGKATSFESCTPELYRLRDHLVAAGVTTVAMEATGVYWLPLFEVLEAAKIDVCLVNGAHVKNLPGRKSDVQDCQWLQQLHACGLLRKSFVPPEQIRALRSYSRLREDHIRQGAMHVQLMQKALDQM